MTQAGGPPRTGRTVTSWEVTYTELVLAREQDRVSTERHLLTGSHYVKGDRRQDLGGLIVGIEYIGSATTANVSLPSGIAGDRVVTWMMSHQRPEGFERWKETLSQFARNPDLARGRELQVLNLVLVLDPTIVRPDTLRLTLGSGDPRGLTLQCSVDVELNSVPDLPDQVTVIDCRFHADVDISLDSGGVGGRNRIVYSYTATTHETPSREIKMLTQIDREWHFRHE